MAHGNGTLCVSMGIDIIDYVTGIGNMQAIRVAL